MNDAQKYITEAVDAIVEGDEDLARTLALISIALSLVDMVSGWERGWGAESKPD